MTGTYLGLLGCGFLTGAAVRMVQASESLSLLESGAVAMAVIAVGAWLLKREERQRAADRASFERAIDKVSESLADKLVEMSAEMKSGRDAAVRDFESKLDRIEDAIRNHRGGGAA